MSDIKSGKPDSRQLSRRRFITDTAQAACAVSLLGLGLSWTAEKSAAHAAQVLRPPGALPEDEFLASCLRCGICVKDCPYDVLTLATPEEPVASGTPWFNARENPCLMCEDIPCITHCPSGSLSPELKDINDAQMGLAVLIDRENCLNLQGLRCDVCYRVCPLIDEAITLQISRNTRTNVHAMFEPVVHADACTGCGKCEHACVLDEAAIKVVPRELARGELGSHYRLGWQEEERTGNRLVPRNLKLPAHRPLGDES
ncbi:ferredoxin-type protein NapG [Endozoicomonas ascidiicola]|uniref:ferredoxin-type protein NapG n=1 Tax=Endozoicomonas ascidiicola TaxID=1698521 RepID=UPI0008336BB0|nr:ferredoxin-type protein NapG [Endozoicomonas ascidiicola]